MLIFLSFGGVSHQKKDVAKKVSSLSKLRGARCLQLDAVCTTFVPLRGANNFGAKNVVFAMFALWGKLSKHANFGV